MLKKLLYKILQPFLWYKIQKLKKIYKDKRIAFYGAGIYAQEIFENFDFADLNILGIIDRDYGKKGTKISDFKILMLDDIKTLSPDIIILTVQNGSIIAKGVLNNLYENNIKIRIVYDFNYEVDTKKYNEKISELEQISESLNPVYSFFDSMPAFKDIISGLTGIFLSCIIPKKKNSVVFIGKAGKHFLDNTKHLFNHMNRISEQNIDYSFLTEDKATYEMLKEKKLSVCLYPSFKSIFKLLRTSAVIIDSATWIENYKYHLLFRSKKFQLWHGVGFKLIRLLEPEFKKIMLLKAKGTFLKRLKYNLRGDFPKYDILNSTSEFYTKNVFKPAFLPEEIFEGGYPRNDVLLRDPDELDLIETDIENYNKILDYKNNGYKIVLYVPTFRDNRNDPILDGAINLLELSEFAQKNKIIFVFKFHPSPKADYTEFNKLKNIIIYNNIKDIYPAMQNIDLMITDYSSIYMDYLLLDRPVVFFPYDYNEYVLKDRDIQFDYNWITPGQKCYNQVELFQEIENSLIHNIDNFKDKREEIRNIAFKNPDENSAQRILDFIKKKYMKI